MAEENKCNLGLPGRSVDELLNQVPGLAENIIDLLRDFQAHNHDALYPQIGDCADAVHDHTAAQVTEQANKRFMTDAERSAISSLETSYAKADFSNVTTQSLGQDGYCKFPNGLLIQWGIRNGSTGFANLYLPISFYDTSYNVHLTGVIANTSEAVVYAPSVYTKTTSTFMFATRCYTSVSSSVVWTGWQFTWFAIGRWK